MRISAIALAAGLLGSSAIYGQTSNVSVSAAVNKSAIVVGEPLRIDIILTSTVNTILDIGEEPSGAIQVFVGTFEAGAKPVAPAKIAIPLNSKVRLIADAPHDTVLIFDQASIPSLGKAGDYILTVRVELPGRSAWQAEYGFQVRDHSAPLLRSACSDLVTTIQRSETANAQLYAAAALSLIHEPSCADIVSPLIGRVRSVDSILITWLAEMDSASADEGLIAGLASNSDTALLSRKALQRIEKRPIDRTRKERIESALGRNP